MDEGKSDFEPVIESLIQVVLALRRCGGDLDRVQRYPSTQARHNTQGNPVYSTEQAPYSTCNATDESCMWCRVECVL